VAERTKHRSFTLFTKKRNENPGQGVFVHLPRLTARREHRMNKNDCFELVQKQGVLFLLKICLRINFAKTSKKFALRVLDVNISGTKMTVLTTVKNKAYFSLIIHTSQ